MPKFLNKYLPKISVSSAAYPNFSFRQLPPASVSFRRLPWTSVDNGQPSPHILLGRRQQSMWDVGAEAKVFAPIFT